MMHFIIMFMKQIADFGMSRDLQNESHYISSTKQIPIKWTAPEVYTIIIKLILNIILTHNYRH